MKRYGTIEIRLDIEVDGRVGDLKDKDLQDYLETNLDHDLKAVLNYAKKTVTLGPDGEGRVVSSGWSWK